MNKKFLGILIFFLCVALYAIAQPNFDDDTNDVPIDGGIGLLLAAGLGYGAKKARDAYKSTKSDDVE